MTSARLSSADHLLVSPQPQKKKKKHKGNEQRRSRKEETDSSLEDSEGEAGQVSTEELLKRSEVAAPRYRKDPDSLFKVKMSLLV